MLQCDVFEAIFMSFGVGLHGYIMVLDLYWYDIEHEWKSYWNTVISTGKWRYLWGWSKHRWRCSGLLWQSKLLEDLEDVEQEVEVEQTDLNTNQDCDPPSVSDDLSEIESMSTNYTQVRNLVWKKNNMPLVDQALTYIGVTGYPQLLLIYPLHTNFFIIFWSKVTGIDHCWDEQICCTSESKFCWPHQLIRTS